MHFTGTSHFSQWLYHTWNHKDVSQIERNHCSRVKFQWGKVSSMIVLYLKLLCTFWQSNFNCSYCICSTFIKNINNLETLILIHLLFLYLLCKYIIKLVTKITHPQQWSLTIILPTIYGQTRCSSSPKKMLDILIL
jgi:hypothetical protein